MRLTYFGVDHMPMVEPGDDLVQQILDSLAEMGEVLQDDDVVVIAQRQC